MEQRSYLGELVLVVIVGVFVVSCLAVLNAVHRGLPQPAALAAAETPSATATPVPAARTALPLVGTSVTTTATKAAPVPTATPASSLAQYVPVTGKELDGDPSQYTGKKVLVTGSVSYVNPRGENTWVQVLTLDNVYVDVNFTGQTSVTKGQRVKVYGTADGKTTIRASDGLNYVQPFINPGDKIDQA